MTEQQSTYRQIFKATSIFGGVQAFNILINIIKSKVIAILLGPGGIGLLGLFNSTLEVVRVITGLGLNSSAVKEISQSVGSGDMKKVSHILKTLRRWLYITGGIGFIVTLALAPYLSLWTFGNKDYTWSFVWLSIVLFLSALSSGQLAVLQGMRKISYMAKSSMIGSFIGLVVSIPLFYFFLYKGIVLSIIVSAICTLIFSSVYARKIKTMKVEEAFIKSLAHGMEMIKLGVAMTFGGALTIITGYLLKAYITQNGGIDDAGIFQSGISITEGYFGLIFTAMATDFYPRLAIVNNDNVKIKDEVNKQAEIGVLIATPIIIVALFLMPVAIKILYSGNFIDAVPYINWAMLGNIFKIGSWAMGYILIAKGKYKIFIYEELLSSLFFLFFNWIGYNLWDLEGLGVAFLIYYIFHFIGIYVLCSYLFEFHFERVFWKLLFIAIIISASAFYVQSINFLWLKCIFAIIGVGLSFYLSYVQLDRRLNLSQFILKKRGKK